MSATSTRPRPPRQRSPRRQAQPSRLPVVAGLVVLGLLGIAVIVSLLSGQEELGGARLQVSAVTVGGEALPPFASSAPDAAVGTPAPQVSGLTIEGFPADLTPDGRPLVVLFATHWCAYCQQEVTELSPWLAAGAADDLGVDVIAVSSSVDERQGNYPPSDWFEREGWPAPVLRDDAASSAASAYGLTSFPYFVVLDADGQVLVRHSGGLGTEALTTLVESVTP